MAASLIQKASNTSVLATVSATFTNAPEAGNLLVAAVTANVGTGSITISGWSTATSIAVGIAGGLVIFYKVSVGNETTVTSSATLAAFMDLHIFEYAGIDNASPLDKTATTADGGVGVTSRASGTTATLTQANELGFAAVAMAGTNGGGASWTNSFVAETTTTDLITSDIIVNATTALSTTGSWNTSQRAAGAIVTFLGETGNSYALKIPLKPLLPVINWSNPLTKGLFFDSAMFERGSTTTVDLAGKRKGTITTATFTTDSVGAGINFAGSGGDRIDFPMTIAKPVLFSMSALFIIKAYDATARRLWELDNGAGANVDFLQMTNAPLFSYGATTSATSGAWTITQPTAGVIHSFVLTHDRSALANNPVMYLDGTKVTVTTATVPTGTFNTASQNLIVGNRTLGDSARPFNGKMFSFRNWSRILNDQEVKQLYANPWQIYDKPVI